MSQPAPIEVTPSSPPGVLIAAVLPADRRLVTGLDSGPAARSTLLSDDLVKLSEQSASPIVLNLLNVDWIDSGACAVLIRYWKALRTQGRLLAIAVTPPVLETFRITGLVRLVPCYLTLEEAVDAARLAEPKA